MKVLVAYASKHGSTAEIARAIALDLRADGLAVDVQQVGDVSAVDPYDAVILGSAVYMGHWLEAARDLAVREAVALRQRDVWLFSTGPIGEPPKPAENAVDVSEVMYLTHAREHQLFEGKIDRTRLGFVERSLVAALRVPDGDFRDWSEIRHWAGTIRAELSLRAVAGG